VLAHVVPGPPDPEVLALGGQLADEVGQDALTVACLFLVLALAVSLATRTRMRAAAPGLDLSTAAGGLRPETARPDDSAAARPRQPVPTSKGPDEQYAAGRSA
jgi:hypothetical protein